MSAHALDRIVGLSEPLAPCSFALRSSLWVEPAYLCTFSIVPKALPWPVLGFKFLCDGVTLFGSSVHTYVCTRSDRRFSLGVVWLCVPSQWVHPVGSCICFSYVHDRFVGTFCCWLLHPCLACHTALDSGLSPSGLICCYALSSSFVDYSPLVVHPSVACP